MKKLLMIAAMAMFATVACDKDEDPQPPVEGAPKATIVAAPATVAVDAAGAFNVTLEKAATEDVTIAVANAGEATLTVAAAEIKITKGATTASVAFTGKAEGSAKVTFSTTSKAIELVTKELTVAVTTTAPPAIKYGEVEFGTYQYASLGYFTLGTTKIEGGEGGVLYEGAAKLDANFTVNFMPSGGSGETGPTDLYSIIIYADWNKDGKFDGANEKVFEKLKFAAGSAAQDITGTITIPADAAATSMIRVVSFFVEDASGNPGDSDVTNGVGYIESGNVFDITYTK